jgi:hypothetical protein
VLQQLGAVALQRRVLASLLVRHGWRSPARPQAREKPAAGLLLRCRASRARRFSALAAAAGEARRVRRARARTRWPRLAAATDDATRAQSCDGHKCHRWALWHVIQAPLHSGWDVGCRAFWFGREQMRCGWDAVKARGRGAGGREGAAHTPQWQHCHARHRPTPAGGGGARCSRRVISVGAVPHASATDASAQARDNDVAMTHT